MNLPFCIQSILEPHSLKRGVLVYTPERAWLSAVAACVNGPTYYVGKHPPHNTTVAVSEFPAAAVVIVDDSPLPKLSHKLRLIVVKTSPFFDAPEEFEHTLRVLRRNDGLPNALPLADLLKGYVFYDDYQLPARVFDRADLHELAKNVKNVAVVRCNNQKRMAAFFTEQGFTPHGQGYVKGDTTVHVMKKGEHTPLNGVRQFHDVAPSTVHDLHKDMACFMHLGSHAHLPASERNIHVFTYHNAETFPAWDVSRLIKSAAPPFLKPQAPVFVESHTLANGESVSEVSDDTRLDAEASDAQFEERGYSAIMGELFIDRPDYTLSQLLKETRRRKGEFSYVAAYKAARALVGTVVEIPDGALGVVAVDGNAYSVQTYDAELHQIVATLNKNFKSVFDGTSSPNWAGAAHHFFKKNKWSSGTAVMDHYIDALPPKERERVAHLSENETKESNAEIYGRIENGVLILNIYGVDHEGLRLKKKQLAIVAQYVNDGQISVFSQNGPQLCVEIELLLRAKDHEDARCWFQRNN